jgi:hypothetical protein
MRRRSKSAAFLAILLCTQQIAGAQARKPDLVPRAELRSTLRSVAGQRDVNLKKIRRVLEHADVARQGERVAGFARISRALSTLDDRTLAQLALQSDHVWEQVQGEGAGKVLTIIVLILIILVVIATAALPESS